MARRRKPVEAAKKAQATAQQVVKGRALLGPMHQATSKAPKRFNRGISKVKAEGLVREVDERISAGDMGELDDLQFVALFCWMHEAIYDVSCLDEVRPEWNVAARQVARMLEEEFGNDRDELLEYVRFAAKDEERRELWRRSNRRSGKRVRWRDFFMHRGTLADYRLHKARTEGPA